MKTDDAPNSDYTAPLSKIYKGELIVKATGETGSIMNDSDLNKVIVWCDKCRSEKFGYRITGENIYLYNVTTPPSNKK
jgi:hypothetical protein